MSVSDPPTATRSQELRSYKEPDAGTIHLTRPEGTRIDVVQQKDAVRQTLGYLPQEFGVYPKVSAVDLLDHFAFRPMRASILIS